MGAVKCTLPPGRLVAALRLQVSIPWPLLLPWVTTHPAGCLCYHGILPPTSGPRTNPRPLGNSPSAPESIRILLDLTSLVHSLPSKASPGPYTLKSGKKKSPSHKADPNHALIRGPQWAPFKVRTRRKTPTMWHWAGLDRDSTKKKKKKRERTIGRESLTIFYSPLSVWHWKGSNY